jgi:hypothetical protein
MWALNFPDRDAKSRHSKGTGERVILKFIFREFGCRIMILI